MRTLIFRSSFSYKPLLGAFLLLISLCSEAHTAQVIDRVVALVNGDMISLYELYERMEPFAEKVKNSGYSLAEQRPLLFQLREEKLRELIEEKLADQEIERLGIAVNESEVDAAIERFKEVNQLNDQSLKESLSLQGFTVDTFRERIKKQLLRVVLVNREVRTKIVVTDEDIEQYYHTHQEKFGSDARYHLKNILKTITPGASEEQKRLLFEELTALRQRIATVDDFEAAAKAHSDAPNRNDGGEIGELPLDSLSGPIREAILKLKPGEVSTIVETDQGYQIFLLVDSVQSSGKPLETVKKQIGEELYQAQVDRAYGKWLDELYNSAYIKKLP